MASTINTLASDSGKGDSKAIVSNQQGVHEKLGDVVKRHLDHDFKKPYQKHTEQAFAEINVKVQAFLADNPSGNIILDACCGVGQSTRILAQQNLSALVIGVDNLIIGLTARSRASPVIVVLRPVTFVLYVPI